MATKTVSFPKNTGPDREQYHVYHAEAKTLTGELQHPIHQPVDFQGHVILSKTRREGHITRNTAASSLEGLISFKAAFTRASGNRFEKTDMWGNPRAGWVTLSTSVIEGLNIFEVVTADRVVAQVSTEHPSTEGHVPKVTFLGSRFDNLRIAGYPVEVVLNLGICGKKPAGDNSYLRQSDFLARVAQQDQTIAQSKGLPPELKNDYDGRVTSITELKKAIDAPIAPAKLHCSIVEAIKPVQPIPIPGLEIYGNVIYIPDFGTVTLGDVELSVEKIEEEFTDRRKNGGSKSSESEYTTSFELKMLMMRLGCIGGGSATAATAKTNGMTRP